MTRAALIKTEAQSLLAASFVLPTNPPAVRHPKRAERVLSNQRSAVPPAGGMGNYVTEKPLASVWQPAGGTCFPQARSIPPGRAVPPLRNGGRFWFFWRQKNKCTLSGAFPYVSLKHPNDNAIVPKH